MKSFERIGERWAAGQTNLPLFSIEWFRSDQFGPMKMYMVVHHDGSGADGYATDMSDKGGPIKLSAKELENLKKGIAELPSPPPGPIPLMRRILVCGSESNSWFAAIYDRADVPFELERLYEHANRPIQWDVPTIRSSGVGSIVSGMENPIFNSIPRPYLATARDVPVAVTCSPGLGQVWDLRTMKATPITATNLYRVLSVELATDGKTVVLGGEDTVVAIEIQTGNTVWERKDLYPHHSSHWQRQAALLNGGVTLATAGPRKVELWSMQNGLTTLVLGASTDAYINTMKASRDGSVLATDRHDGPVKVWTGDWTKAAIKFADGSNPRLLDVSPDGRYVAMSVGHWSKSRLVIHDLKSKSRQEMPFRGCFNSGAWSCGAWSPDGLVLAVAPKGGLPTLLDTSTWKPIVRWRIRPGEEYEGGIGTVLRFASDGSLLAFFEDGTLHLLKPPFLAEVEK